MLIQLPSLWIVILDIITWFILHMGISLLMLKVPDRWFEKEHALFKRAIGNKMERFGKKSSVFENGKTIYQIVLPSLNVPMTNLNCKEQMPKG